MKEIVVVGGGTAGWLTALFCRQNMPGANITLVESSEIGILGAGEGTTPHFINILKELKLPLVDVFNNANATVKNGILFTDWNGDGSSFFHPFFDEASLLDKPYFAGKRIAEGRNLDTLVPSYFLSSYNKVKFFPEGKKLDARQWGNCALHFDARKLADYLKTVGKQRNVSIVDSKVEKINEDSCGNITSIALENGIELKCDFIFDCTGFKRLIIGQHYKSEWKTYSNIIPNNKAIPFFISQKENEVLPPYTEAIAMKYGWVWKIPVQGRYGCGYVYDSRCVSDQQIKEEIKLKFGEVETPRSFNFEPGTFKEIWKGNCIATGLASGFIEPLEATSIWVTISILNNFLHHITGALYNNTAARDAFNKHIYNLNEEILAFIYFHYITLRKDTAYWRDFAKNNEYPSAYEKIKQNQNYIDFNNLTGVLPNSFERGSILAVGAGGYFFTPESGESLMRTIKHNNSNLDYQKFYQENTEIVTQAARKCPTHMELLKYVKEGYE